MVKSFQEIFEAYLINTTTGKRIQEVDTVDNSYVLVEKDINFLVVIEAKYPHKQFAARLFFDGKVVGNFRVFKGKQTYRGFSQGDGTFKEFKFSIPEYKYEQGKGQDRDQGLIGQIRIELFDTIEYKVKGKLKQKFPSKKLKFEETTLFLDKKAIGKTLTVKEGNTLERKVSKHSFNRIQNERYDPLTDTSIEYKANPSQQIDEITFKYADYDQLLLKNLLSIYNVEHLKYIPDKHLIKNEYMLGQIVKAILSRAPNKALSLIQLELEFVKWTKRKFDELMVGGICDFLLFQKRNEFKFDPNTQKFHFCDIQFNQRITLFDINFKPINQSVRDLQNGSKLQQQIAKSQQQGQTKSVFAKNEVILID